MSGRKYSQVELANNVREAIACRMAAAEAYARAQTLVAALGEAAATTAALKSLAASAEATLNEIRQQLESLKDLFHESQMMAMPLSQVRAQRQKVEQLKTQLEDIAKKCREGNSAAAQRAELSALQKLLEKNRLDLEPWLRDVYDNFTQETTELITHADQEIQATGAMPSVAGKVPEQAAQYQHMIAKVDERRKSDAERQYIAQKLQQVCKEMGFDAKLLPQKGLLDDLVLEVDTYAYGLVHFRLQLDGTIRSQSEMIEPACCLNFAMIEDQLRTMGVISSFRYEGDQQPVRLRKGEKSLPDSEPAAAIGKAL